MINTVFNVSEEFGHDRDINRIALKLMEEVGELSVEVNIINGFIDPSKGGKDGVLGEGNDVINCVLDLMYVVMKNQNPSLSTNEIIDIIQSNQERKCNKWREVALKNS